MKTVVGTYKQCLLEANDVDSKQTPSLQPQLANQP